MKLQGFDELNKQLNKLQKNAQNLEGQNKISFDELFNDTFMTRNTDFRNINDFFDKSPFVVDSSTDFEAIPQDELDQYVSSHSKFSTLEEMQHEAASQWTFKKLGL